MSFVVLLLILAVIGGIALVAAGGGDGMGPAEPDRSPRGALPAGGLDRSAIDGLRFTLAFRGYRMDEVDEVLDRLAGALEERDACIAELRGTASIVHRGDGTVPPAIGESRVGERADGQA